ncbi:A disintegrin and metalloproteinase with thrombospondin motifs 13-like [Lampetra planeri]
MTPAPPVTPTTKTPLVTTQAAHDAAPSTEFSTSTTPSSSSSSASSFSTSSTAPQLPASCGLQVTAPAGIVRLDARPGVDCSVAFARPLGEVVSVHVLQHNMECSAGDYAMVLERLSWRRLCEGSRNTTLSSRTNNLVVRLRAAGGRRGLRVAFAARRARRPQHRECDVQLTGIKGRIGAPQAVAGGGGGVVATQPCRAYINVPPQRRIVLRAMVTSGAGRGAEQDGACDGHVVVRDMETLKAVPVCGPRPLVWKSSGSRAEIEFHGRLGKQTSSFIALYRAIDPGAPLSGT